MTLALVFIFVVVSVPLTSAMSENRGALKSNSSSPFCKTCYPILSFHRGVRSFPPGTLDPVRGLLIGGMAVPCWHENAS